MRQKALKSAVLFFCIFLITANFISGCRQKNGDSKHHRLKIITTLFPLYDFTKNIAGEKADVSLILPPGVEAHSFEPKAGDILRINSADMFIYTGKFMEPWAENLIKGIENKKLSIIDASSGIKFLELHNDKHGHRGFHGAAEEHGNIDPHIWLDMTNVQIMIDNILTGLTKKDPINRDYYQKNAEEYKAKIVELDEKFKKNLDSCKKRVILHGGHFAFGYLAQRYNLEYISAYRGSPDAEPTPKIIAQMKRIIQEKDIKYIFYEEIITPRIAYVLEKETGVGLLKLHGCHNISKEEMDKGVTFISIMEENLKNLKKGLECP